MALLLSILSAPLPQDDSGGLFGALFGGVCWLVSAILIVLFLAGMWKMYVKAGQPGWAAIIPIYNIYVLMKIIGRPGWWLILFFIPIVGFVVGIIVSIDLAKSFGKSAAWGVILLFILNFIGYLILGFGSDKYLGPSAGQGGAMAAAIPAPAPPALPAEPSDPDA